MLLYSVNFASSSRPRVFGSVAFHAAKSLAGSQQQARRPRIHALSHHPCDPPSFSLVARSSSSTRLFGSSSSKSSSSTASKEEKRGAVPMTLLAGFLGTGKTTALKHLLENTDNVKIGVIVNDVASVNIDAKLVSGQVGNCMIELQNGCACCSLADELFFSVENLLENRELDALVVELSGVADPMVIRNNWKMAPKEVRQLADIRNVVTLVDSQTFGTDYMTWDVVQDRKGWGNADDPCAGNQKVSELLAEQVEAADLVLLNKVDLATNEQVEIADQMVRALNDKATLLRVQFGKVTPTQLLGNHNKEEVEENEEDAHHAHDHNHENNNACGDSTCTDASHSHDHHDHDHSTSPSALEQSASSSSSQSHSHSHDHNSASSCDDPTCTDPSHSHDHHNEHAACHDPDCTDTSHSHSHSHDTSTDQLGIVNFVYKATKPFSTERLLMLLKLWPIPKKDVLDLEFLEHPMDSSASFNAASDPFVGVLRAKGFCWFAPSQWRGFSDDSWRHDTAMYLSQAGRHMSITGAGKWWATIPKQNLPKYFNQDNQTELDRILREDFVSEEFGDRRQELVFIGADIDESAIRQALDHCLLTDEEMDEYRAEVEHLQRNTIATTSSRNI
ncbi:hypothetical protein ACA910_005580 [Epithemia clementina (nom. ined.)]